ncbi:uncharacterized protein FOMMEDRAFT_152915 [Fomitiporia mediterranea MF3/22]|uniref:uncharacterized protein n=1 Tax=Fomitiporia mediterranea (strain MF3/22) TaxID=694068 RepID=UPI0004409A2D|nr:uncharacterized protein FOMMEDRAFT_152915 [Fomitiporia mediterranea MF3/22]EJD05589.1 hypothetical protein FOMMEDRAFT_152915 [Fomitiporia mediterranea MF3/22]
MPKPVQNQKREKEKGQLVLERRPSRASAARRQREGSDVIISKSDPVGIGVGLFGKEKKYSEEDEDKPVVIRTSVHSGIGFSTHPPDRHRDMPIRMRRSSTSHKIEESKTSEYTEEAAESIATLSGYANVPPRSRDHLSTVPEDAACNFQASEENKDGPHSRRDSNGRVTPEIKIIEPTPPTSQASSKKVANSRGQEGANSNNVSKQGDNDDSETGSIRSRHPEEHDIDGWTEARAREAYREGKLGGETGKKKNS